MKKSINLVYELYPNVRRKLENDNTITLNEKEEVFYKLALFFQSPEYSFDLAILYERLDGEDLMNALNSITTFFKEDTYLLNDFKTETYTVVKEGELYNQKMFSDYLVCQGFSTMIPKVLNVYYKRGKLPTPDLMIGNKPYWTKSKIEKFAEYLKKEKTNLYKKDE